MISGYLRLAVEFPHRFSGSLDCLEEYDMFDSVDAVRLGEAIQKVSLPDRSPYCC